MGLSKRDIVFDIDQDGNITITVEGVKGKDCTDLTKELEEAFGVVIDRTHTSEFYQDEVNERLTIKLGGD
jgi:hypothetical protein